MRLVDDECPKIHPFPEVFHALNDIGIRQPSPCPLHLLTCLRKTSFPQEAILECSSERVPTLHHDSFSPSHGEQSAAESSIPINSLQSKDMMQQPGKKYSVNCSLFRKLCTLIAFSLAYAILCLAIVMRAKRTVSSTIALGVDLSIGLVSCQPSIAPKLLTVGSRVY